MPQSVAELLDLLELEEIEVGLYRGRQPKTALQRVFGGQVLAQALMASSDTVPAERRLHSMHAYFIRPGRTDVPIVSASRTCVTGDPSPPGGWWPARAVRSSSSRRPRSISPREGSSTKT